MFMVLGCVACVCNCRHLQLCFLFPWPNRFRFQSARQCWLSRRKKVNLLKAHLLSWPLQKVNTRCKIHTRWLCTQTRFQRRDFSGSSPHQHLAHRPILNAAPLYFGILNTDVFFFQTGKLILRGGQRSLYPPVPRGEGKWSKSLFSGVSPPSSTVKDFYIPRRMQGRVFVINSAPPHPDKNPGQIFLKIFLR